MYFFNIKPYTDQYFTYYYMMSANWVSVKIMVPSECRPTGFLPTARPPSRLLLQKENITELPVGRYISVEGKTCFVRHFGAGNSRLCYPLDKMGTS